MQRRINIFEVGKKFFHSLMGLVRRLPFLDDDPNFLCKGSLLVELQPMDDRLCNTEQEYRKIQILVKVQAPIENQCLTK